jgi:integrase
MARARGTGGICLQKGSGGRPDTYYKIVYIVGPDGKERASRRTGKTQQEVLEKVNALIVQQASGQVTLGKEGTVAYYLNLWLDTKAVDLGEDSSGYRMHETLVRVHLRRALGHLELQKLGSAEIQKFLNDKRRERKPSGVRRYSDRRVQMMRKTLSAFLRWAMNQKPKILTDDPMTGVSPIPRADPLTTALEREQVDRLLDTSATHQHGPLFALLVYTGLRLGEALALRWHDIDFEKQLIQVRGSLKWLPNQPWTITRPKTKGSVRDVPLKSNARQALLNQKAQQDTWRLQHKTDWLSTGLVFTSPTGDAQNGKNVLGVFKRQLKKAKLPTTFRVHDLRHTCATHLLVVTNGDVYYVSKWLGHASIRTTEMYLHVVKQQQNILADKFDAYWSASASSATGTDS